MKSKCENCKRLEREIKELNQQIAAWNDITAKVFGLDKDQYKSFMDALCLTTPIALAAVQLRSAKNTVEIKAALALLQKHTDAFVESGALLHVAARAIG